MPKSNITKVKEIYIVDMVKKTAYAPDTVMGKALCKDLKKLNIATLAILKQTIKGGK